MFAPATPSEREAIIKIIKNNVSPGYDHIATAPLHYISVCISEMRALIINIKIETGVFPDNLKIAQVCPIYKGGDRNDISIYRTISILPVISKVFEGLLTVEYQTFSTNITLYLQHSTAF